MASESAVTDFSQYSLDQLNQMLTQSDPTSCQNQAQAWESTGQLLSEQAQNLQAKLNSIDPAWTGTAAVDYKQMMTDLIGGIQKVATTAFTMRDVTFDALDALNIARAQMPTTTDVPVASSSTLTSAAAPVLYSQYLSPGIAAQFEQEQATGQQAIAAATTAQAKAIAVMQALANSYATAQAGIPSSSDGAGSAASGSVSAPSSTSGTGVSLVADQSGAVLTASSATTSVTLSSADDSSGLFGDMFTVGIAAAAAVGGTIAGLVRGKSSSKAASDSDPESPEEGVEPAAAEDTGVLVPDPGGDPSSAASVASASRAAAESGADGEPMMPMMPMGGAPGAAGMGDGAKHRVPTWLVERQDVWGASIPAAPGLIGE